MLYKLKYNNKSFEDTIITDITTIFTRFVAHIRMVALCVTIQVQISLFSWLILIVVHLQIVPHVQIFRSK